MFKGNTIADLFQYGFKNEFLGLGALCPVHTNGKLINMLVSHCMPFSFYPFIVLKVISFVGGTYSNFNFYIN